MEQAGRFYRLSESVKKQLFSHGGLPKEFKTLSDTLNELVRRPAIEIINYLNQTNFDAPVTRYLLCEL